MKICTAEPGTVQLVLPPPDPTCGRLSRSGCFPPLGLVSIATELLRQTGHRAEILDGELLDIDEIIERIDADIVGVSPSQVTYTNALRIAEQAKSRGARVVFGGHHATALASQIVTNRACVDCVVIGDGEEAFSALATGRRIDSIPNVVWRAAGDMIQRGPTRNVALDSACPLDRSLLDLESYFRNFEEQNPHKPFRRPFSIFTQKGCGWRDRSGGCSFCARTDVGWRARAPKLVWKEIRSLVEEFGADYIWELSDDILSDRNWFSEFVESKPKELNPAFLLYARPAAVTPEAADQFLRLNAYEVFVGVEAGDDRLLVLSNKGSTSFTNLRATRLLKDRGIRVFPSFILGLQGEDHASLAQTEAHLLDILDGGLVDTVAISTFMPLPGSPSHRALMGVPEMGNDLRCRDDVDLRFLQRAWCRHFCSVSLEELEEARERMIAYVPQASGLVTRAGTT